MIKVAIFVAGICLFLVSCGNDTPKDEPKDAGEMLKEVVKDADTALHEAGDKVKETVKDVDTAMNQAGKEMKKTTDKSKEKIHDITH